MGSRILWRVALGVLAAHFVFCCVTWFNLPARIPIHFGLSGEADSFVGKSVFFWFLLFGVSLFDYGLIKLLSHPAGKELWNIPQKSRFDKLPPEKQVPVVKLIDMLGAATVAGLGLLMFALQVGMYLTAKEVTTGLPWYIQLVVFAVPVLILVGLVPWSRAIKNAIARAEGAEVT